MANKPKRLGVDPFSAAPSGLDLLIGSTKDEPQTQTLSVKGKRGRPKTINRVLTKTSQSGLHDGWTRATFIVKEKTLDKMKERAYIDRRKLKDVVDDALEMYLTSSKPEEDNHA